MRRVRLGHGPQVARGSETGAPDESRRCRIPTTALLDAISERYPSHGTEAVEDPRSESTCAASQRTAMLASRRSRRSPGRAQVGQRWRLKLRCIERAAERSVDSLPLGARAETPQPAFASPRGARSAGERAGLSLSSDQVPSDRCRSLQIVADRYANPDYTTSTPPKASGRGLLRRPVAFCGGPWASRKRQPTAAYDPDAPNRRNLSAVDDADSRRSPQRRRR